ALFEKHGFNSHTIEYWDEEKQFHTSYNNDENGYIRRSYINDLRNKSDVPRYTSLIVDFKKKLSSEQ
ncbi:MAG: SAM-dependent methyltransferase, partial [Ignavibacteria bacterium]